MEAKVGCWWASSDFPIDLVMQPIYAKIPLSNLVSFEVAMPFFKWSFSSRTIRWWQVIFNSLWWSLFSEFKRSNETKIFRFHYRRVFTVNFDETPWNPYSIDGNPLALHNLPAAASVHSQTSEERTLISEPFHFLLSSIVINSVFFTRCALVADSWLSMTCDGGKRMLVSRFNWKNYNRKNYLSECRGTTWTTKRTSAFEQ